MAIPDYQTVMLPLLRFVTRTGESSTPEATAALAVEFGLSEDELRELLPSGVTPRFLNRVGWAATYMKKAGLLEATRRAHFRITPRGEELLRANPPAIDVKLLQRYPEFVEFQHLKGTRTRNEPDEVIEEPAGTPLEGMEAAYQNLHDELAAELLKKLKHATPTFFEKTVVDLLVKMGYGGSRSDAGKAIGQSGDGGIDGIIKEDRLGLDAVYIQAKRWDNASVGGSVVMQFAGALQRRKASKGVFITTSTFTKDAVECAKEMGSRIVLIDGEELTNLMIEHGVGVSTVSEYVVKKVDADYFEEGQ
jgi:restriction system protein